MYPYPNPNGGVAKSPIEFVAWMSNYIPLVHALLSDRLYK